MVEHCSFPQPCAHWQLREGLMAFCSSYLILSYLILSYLILSYLILSSSSYLLLFGCWGSEHWTMLWNSAGCKSERVGDDGSRTAPGLRLKSINSSLWRLKSQTEPVFGFLLHSLYQVSRKWTERKMMILLVLQADMLLLLLLLLLLLFSICWMEDQGADTIQIFHIRS